MKRGKRLILNLVLICCFTAVSVPASAAMWTVYIPPDAPFTTCRIWLNDRGPDTGVADLKPGQTYRWIAPDKKIDLLCIRDVHG